MNFMEELRSEWKAKEDFENQHGYTMPEATSTLDGQTVPMYTFNQMTMSVQVGCRAGYENDNHGNPLIIRLKSYGDMGQGEARMVMGETREPYIEVTSCGCWEYSDTVRTFEFILDVLKNGKPTRDYCVPLDNEQENPS